MLNIFGKKLEFLIGFIVQAGCPGRQQFNYSFVTLSPQPKFYVRRILS